MVLKLSQMTPYKSVFVKNDIMFEQMVHMSRYALESPVPPADLIALSPGYRVPPDLATVPYAPWHTRFVLVEAATSDRMFEMTLSAP